MNFAGPTSYLKVIDVRAEGISLTITQRDEFSSIIGTKGLAPLLAYMREDVAPEPVPGGQNGEMGGDAGGETGADQAGGADARP